MFIEEFYILVCKEADTIWGVNDEWCIIILSFIKVFKQENRLQQVIFWV